MFKNMFGGRPAPAQAPAQAQPPASGAKGQIKPDGMNPGDPAKAGVADPKNPDSGNKPKNPLDDFKDLYKIDPAAKVDNPEAQGLQLTDEVLDKVIPSIDFSQGLSPEVQQKIAAGDGNAILEAIKQAGAVAYKTAMQHNSALVNANLDARFKALEPTIQKSVNSNLTSNALASLPNASNPVVKAELDRVAQQLRTKYPEASNQWIAEQTNTYLLELGKQLTPEVEPPKSKLPESVDFAELLKEDS